MSSPLRSVRSAKSVKSKAQKQLSLGQIEHPQKVRVLILTEQKLIFQEYYFLKNFTQIIKLDLSYNRISQFPAGFSFKQFQELKTLFLHYNKFDKLKNLELLADCKKLVYLTLFGNPLEQTRARHFCLNIIPSLKLMDDKPVKQEEKYQGILNFQLNAHNDRVGFPLIEISQNQTSVEFLGCVMREIKMTRDFYLKVNPIIIIQKWWKRQYQKNHANINNPIQFEFESKPQNIQLNSLSKKSQTKNVKGQNNQQVFSKVEEKSIKKEEKQNHNGQKEQKKENLLSRGEKLKILNAFQRLFQGLQSFKYLLAQQQSMFCQKSYCILNGYNYKNNGHFNKKYLTIYKTPFDDPKYDLKRQKSKKFLSMVFYNNFRYVIELKSRKSTFKAQNKTQLKNISAQKQPQQKIVDPLDSELVEIDLTLDQKFSFIKKEYFKSKIPHYQKAFPFLFGINLIKISSAIKIQKRWRGYCSRKKFNALQKVREQFAARKIQKWIRNLRFINRQKFLIESFVFLKNNQASNIMLKLQTFSKLYHTYEKILLKHQFFSLPFQETNFQITEKVNDKKAFDSVGDAQKLNLQSRNTKCQIKLISLSQLFPPYFSRFMEPFELIKPKDSDEDIITKKFKIIDLLIKGAIQVKKFQRSVDIKSKEKNTYVKFQYLNKQDANRRKFLLCLFTYNFRDKGWIDFYSEKDTHNKAKMLDINDEIKNTHFVKMIYDNNKKEKLFQKIDKYTKQIRIKSEIYWMPMKIRYFEGTIDYSSIIIVGTYSKQSKVLDKEQINELNQKQELLQSRNRLKELNSLSTLHNRIALNNIDTKFLTPIAPKSHAHRNLISFSIHLQKDSETSQLSSKEKYEQSVKKQFFNSLHDNQSELHNLDDWGLENSINSYGSSVPLRKSHLSEMINPNESSILDPSISEKQLLIKKVKSSHKYKVEMLTQIRKRQQQQMRFQYKTNFQQHRKLIRESSNQSIMENISKVQRIKEYEKSRSSTKQESQKFQNKFLRKGNLSIQQEMREFQKSRSRSNQLKQEHPRQLKLKKSARYDDKSSHQDAHHKIEQARQYLKIKKQVLKTELKQFSIHLSEGFQHASSVFHETDIQNLESINFLLNEHKKSKDLKSNSKREVLSSATSEKIGKLYEQKRKEFLKSQGKEQMTHKNSDPIIESSQTVMNKKSNERQKIENHDKQKKEHENRKLMKKKKLVHSVFPQEFFPLKDSQQIGFHLPKINSNSSKQ